MSFEQNQYFINGPGVSITLEEVQKAGQEGLPRYYEDASASNIPIEFPRVAETIRLEVDSDQTTGRHSGLKDPHMERCFRLFESSFSNPTQAFYALSYTEALSKVNSLKDLATKESEEVDLVRIPDEVFDSFIARYSQRFDVPEKIIIKDPSILTIGPSDLEKVIDMITRRRFYTERLAISEMIIYNARTETELVVGIPAAMEQRAKVPDGTYLSQTLFRLRQLVTRALTADDLAQAREQVNNYFQNPQKVSRIEVLASSQTRS